jgi:hypothetical protein
LIGWQLLGADAAVADGGGEGAVFAKLRGHEDVHGVGHAFPRKRYVLSERVHCPVRKEKNEYVPAGVVYTAEEAGFVGVFDVNGPR